MGLRYLQAEENLALHLQAFIKEGLKVASPFSLLGQAACLLAHPGLGLHQLIPKLPVAGMGIRCLVTLQPALILALSDKRPQVILAGQAGSQSEGQQGDGRGKAGASNGLCL